MKTSILAVTLLAVAFAEPPPSNSYLPPPPAKQSDFQGQVQDLPEVVAARSLGHGAHGSNFAGARNRPGFARNGPRAQSTFGSDPHNHAFGRTADAANYPSFPSLARTQDVYPYNAARNTIEEASEPANYNFGYMVNDNVEGTDFGHQEERQDERATGEYHVVLPDGRKQTVNYEADERGFKTRISYEDSENRYDSNAQNVRGNSNGYPSNHGNDYDARNHGNDYNGASNHGNIRNGY